MGQRDHVGPHLVAELSRTGWKVVRINPDDPRRAGVYQAGGSGWGAGLDIYLPTCHLDVDRFAMYASEHYR